jgi:ATP-dependent 26S proteasome regulatory subunit
MDTPIPAQQISTEATVSSTKSGTSIKSLTDMLLAQKLVGIFENTILKNNTSMLLSWKQVFGIITMLSIEELKTIITDTLIFFKELLKKYCNYDNIKNGCIIFIHTIKYFVYKVINIITLKRFCNVNKTPILLIKNTISINECSIICDMNFLNILINHFKKNNNINYLVDSAIKIDLNNINSYDRIETWKDISFKLDNINCSILSILEVSVKCQNESEKIQILKSKNINHVETDEFSLITNTGFLTLGKRIYNKQQYYLNHINNHGSNNHIKIDKCILIYDDGGIDNELNIDGIYISTSSVTYYKYLCRLILAYEKKFNRKITNEAWQILTGSTSKLISFKCELNDIYISMEIEKLYEHNKSYKNYYDMMLNYANDGYYIEWKYYYDNNVKTMYKINELYTSKEEIPNYLELISQKNDYKIILTSETKNRYEMTKEFETIIGLLKNKTKISNDNLKKQKTFYLSINRKEIEEITDNKDYNDWIQTVNMLKGNNNNKEDEKNTKINIDLQLSPPKSIIKKKEVVEVSCKEMGLCYKPIDTLYLEEKDLNGLLSSLELFRDNQQLMESIGIPNKYGLFLYGPAGTGKTSTISFVSTYLQKPIYYVSLNEVKYNRELSMLFEYIYEKNVDGGIIVFEDIDCMTNVILKRKSDKDIEFESTVTNIMKDSDELLTLAYLLNIMDGLMSKDGMIIIASSNHPEKIDPAFLRDGRFDIKLGLNFASLYQINTIFTKFFKREIKSDIKLRIKENKYTPAQFIFRFKNFMLKNDYTDEEILEPFLS